MSLLVSLVGNTPVDVLESVTVVGIVLRGTESVMEALTEALVEELSVDDCVGIGIHNPSGSTPNR